MTGDHMALHSSLKGSNTMLSPLVGGSVLRRSVCRGETNNETRVLNHIEIDCHTNALSQRGKKEKSHGRICIGEDGWYSSLGKI